MAVESRILPPDAQIVFKPDPLALARSVLAEYDLPALRENLSGFPARLAGLRARVAEARQAVEDAKRMRDLAEADLLMEIAVATDDKGKPRYTNQETRAAELVRRKATDQPYQQAEGVLKEAERTLSEAQDQLQAAIEEFSVAKYLARLAEAEMRLVAGLATNGGVEE